SPKCSVWTLSYWLRPALGSTSGQARAFAFDQGGQGVTGGRGGKHRKLGERAVYLLGDQLERALVGAVLLDQGDHALDIAVVAAMPHEDGPRLFVSGFQDEQQHRIGRFALF